METEIVKKMLQLLPSENFHLPEWLNSRLSFVVHSLSNVKASKNAFFISSNSRWITLHFTPESYRANLQNSKLN